MAKGKFVLIAVFLTALLCWQFLPMNTQTASSGIVDPCSSSAAFCGSGGRCLLVCPQGDGNDLSLGGNCICVVVRDNTGAPIANIQATDFWVIGCTGSLSLCGGSGSANADSASNSSGQTTICGGIAAGGCELTGLQVVVQGVVIGCPPTCLAMSVVSPDITGDLAVTLADFAVFAAAFPPGPYNACADYDCSAAISLGDFATFAAHWAHSC